MTKLTLCFGVLLTATLISATPANRVEKKKPYVLTEFTDYISKYKRPYVEGTPEYKQREEFFSANLKKILQHNREEEEKGIHGWKMGVNQYTDWSSEEIFGLGNGAVRLEREDLRAQDEGGISLGDFIASGQAADYKQKRVVSSQNHLLTSSSSGGNTSGIDYRLLNDPSVVTAPKNQGFCGSCYAHGTVEAVETYFALQTGELHVLSQQQIISCLNFTHCWKEPAGPGHPNETKWKKDWGGCYGGSPERAFKYIERTGGLFAEWQYPYVDFYIPMWDGNRTTECTFAQHNQTLWQPAVTTTGYVELPENDPKSTIEVLLQHGPVVAYVDCTLWYLYDSGIYRNIPNSSNNFALNHVVVIVGYGVEETSGVHYWILRNTFGVAWGEWGYIRLWRAGPGEKEPCGSSFRTPTRCGVTLNESYSAEACGTSGVLLQQSFPIVAPAASKRRS